MAGINDSIRSLTTRYAALERRDRLSLTGLAAFLGALLLYYGAWEPSNRFLESKRADRDRQLGLVQYMRATEQEARLLGGGTRAVASGQDLLTQVSRTARQFGISPNRMQPEGDEGVSVWFDGVPFNDLVRWLEAQSRSGIGVRQISVDRQEQPGRVNARIVLRN